MGLRPFLDLFKRYKVLTVVLAALVVVGLGCWVYQLIVGLSATGMNNGTSWGLYIISFMFFVGLSVGSLAVASVAYVFKVDRLKAIALPAVIISTVCIGAAGLFVLVDLGSIHRVWRMIIGANIVSPLVWDMCVITLCLIVDVLFLVYLIKGNERKTSIIARIALPCALLVITVDAWLFGLQIAKEGWYSAVLAPIFVASALDSGIALLLLVLSALKKAGIYDVPQGLTALLAAALCVCISIDAFFILCELVTMAYPGTLGGEVVLAGIMTGSNAPFFWFEIIGGLIVPFCILVFAKNRQNSKLVIFSCVLVFVGVICKRIWLLLNAFVVPNVIGAPGIIWGSSAATEATGVNSFAVASSYMPSAAELLVCAGLVSLAILAFMALASKFLGKQHTN